MNAKKYFNICLLRKNTNWKKSVPQIPQTHLMRKLRSSKQKTGIVDFYKTLLWLTFRIVPVFRK